MSTLGYIEWMDRGPLLREEVGGKAASLSELTTSGFPVPAGFVVTAAGYRRFLAAAALDGAAPGALQRLISGAELPDDLAAEIDNAYARLVLRAGETCAVRSSGISEDGADASFAGLYETYLNIRGASEVRRALRRCYASLWSARASLYRENRGSVDEQAMAVVVMSLVPAEVSGVAFTANPVTGARDEVVINASWGLGETIVSGRVTPDFFAVQKGSLALLEREVFPKDLVILPRPGGGGTVESIPSPERAAAPSLTDEQVVDVARLAIAIEAHFGSPQDIEFAIAQGRLSVLQARPITTLS